MMVDNDALYNLIYNLKWDDARESLSSGQIKGYSFRPTDGNEDDFMANILYQNAGGWTTLMDAIRREAPIDIIASLIDKGGKDLAMMKNKIGRTALHWACDKGASVEVVKLLLDVGGEQLIVMKTNDGKTALDNANNNNELLPMMTDLINSNLSFATTHNLIRSGELDR